MARTLPLPAANSEVDYTTIAVDATGAPYSATNPQPFTVNNASGQTANVASYNGDVTPAANTRGLDTRSMNYVFDGTNMVRMRGDATGSYSVSRGTGTIATAQVAVTTSATLVAAARTGRASVTITSTSAVVFYVGATGVTTSTGAYVAGTAGASITISTSAAVYAIGASNLTVSVLETY